MCGPPGDSNCQTPTHGGPTDPSLWCSISYPGLLPEGFLLRNLCSSMSWFLLFPCCLFPSGGSDCPVSHLAYWSKNFPSIQCFPCFQDREVTPKLLTWGARKCRSTTDFLSYAVCGNSDEMWVSSVDNWRCWNCVKISWTIVKSSILSKFAIFSFMHS